MIRFNNKEEIIMSNEIRRDYGQAEQPRNPMGVHQPVVFCIDTSGSMKDKAEDGRTKSQIVEEMINGIANMSLSDYDKQNVDICVLVFDDEVRTLVDWRPLASFDGGIELDVAGTTSLGSAVIKAIEKTRERRAVYAQTGMQCKRAQIFVYTDGVSTESLDDAYALSQEYLNRGEPKPSAKMYITLIPPAADASELKPFGDKVTILRANDCVNGLPAAFKFMEASVVASSVSALGDTTKVEIPEDLDVVNRHGADGTSKDENGKKYVEDTAGDFVW